MKQLLDSHGFTESDLAEMLAVFRSHPSLEKVILFGSRALKTFKPASDVDLVLIYPEDDYRLVSRIKSQLEEDTKIPYFFDVLDFKTIESAELKEHIALHGVEIYKK